MAVAIGWLSVSDNTAFSSTLPDVSWPNCTLRNHPVGAEGIVGVNGGLSFHPNPCLGKQIGWFKSPSVYVNTGYPGLPRATKYKSYPKTCSTRDEKCLAYNYGFNAGRYDIKYGSLQGVIADRWWVDVETENSWSDDPLVNRQSLQGTADALTQYAGKDKVGFYSYPGQWNLITNHWHNYLPVWAATGSKNIQDAIEACNQDSFTGGQVLLAQYTPSLDNNIKCGG